MGFPQHPYGSSLLAKGASGSFQICQYHKLKVGLL
jgi:hypothetical protein